MTALRSAVFIAVLLTLSECGRDFYAILEVSRDATAAQIKKAYKQLAVKYHPDKNKAADAREKFQEISTAYEVLSDKDKKAKYDAHGEEGLKGARNRDAGDIFSQMFGNFRFGFGSVDHQESQGPDLNIDLHLTLEELYNGKDYTVTRTKWQREEGAKPRPCECKQQSAFTVTFTLGGGMQTVKQGCDACKNLYPKVKAEVTLFVNVERGMRDGEKISFAGEADAIGDDLPGNMNFVVREIPHSVYRREGDNLHCTIEVTLKEALIGFSRAYTHLDGHTFTVESNGVLKPGEVLRIVGEGMPRHEIPSEKGDLFVTIRFAMPTALTQEQYDAINRFF